MKLPRKFVEQGLVLAEGTTVYGVPIKDLTTEELIACVAKFGKAIEDERKNASRDMELAMDLLMLKI